MSAPEQPDCGKQPYTEEQLHREEAIDRYIRHRLGLSMPGRSQFAIHDESTDHERILFAISALGPPSTASAVMKEVDKLAKTAVHEDEELWREGQEAIEAFDFDTPAAKQETRGLNEPGADESAKAATVAATGSAPGPSPPLKLSTTPAFTDSTPTTKYENSDFYHCTVQGEASNKSSAKKPFSTNNNKEQAHASPLGTSSATPHFTAATPAIEYEDKHPHHHTKDYDRDFNIPSPKTSVLASKRVGGEQMPASDDERDEEPEVRDSSASNRHQTAAGLIALQQKREQHKKRKREEFTGKGNTGADATAEEQGGGDGGGLAGQVEGEDVNEDTMAGPDGGEVEEEAPPAVAARPAKVRRSGRYVGSREVTGLLGEGEGSKSATPMASGRATRKRTAEQEAMKPNAGAAARKRHQGK